MGWSPNSPSVPHILSPGKGPQLSSSPASIPTGEGRLASPWGVSCTPLGPGHCFSHLAHPSQHNLVIGVTVAAPDVTAVSMAMGRFPRQAGGVCLCTRVWVYAHVCVCVHV